MCARAMRLTPAELSMYPPHPRKVDIRLPEKSLDVTQTHQCCFQDSLEKTDVFRRFLEPFPDAIGNKNHRFGPSVRAGGR